MVQPVYKIVWEFLQNLDIELNTNQQIPFWIPIENKSKYIWPSNLYTNVHNNIIHNS